MNDNMLYLIWFPFNSSIVSLCMQSSPYWYCITKAYQFFICFNISWSIPIRYLKSTFCRRLKKSRFLWCGLLWRWASSLEYWRYTIWSPTHYPDRGNVIGWVGRISGQCKHHASPQYSESLAPTGWTTSQKMREQGEGARNFNSPILLVLLV